MRNLNEALAIDVTNPHKTMSQALEATKANGFDVSKINARASTDGEKHEILWDSRNDCFVYRKGNDINYIPKSNTKGDATPVELWHIANDGTISDTYSNYLAAGTYAGKLSVFTGLDVGDHTEVTEVEYTGNGKDVIFYMNGGKLTVNDNSAAQQYFYGSASQADITTGTSCFHVYGAIAKTNVNAGKVVVENGGMVIVSKAAEGTSVEKNGGIVLAASEDTSFVGNVALSTDAEKAAYALEISTAAELASFRDRVNAGMTYKGLTVKLTADIDLSNQGNWNPIGNRYALNNGKPVDTTKEKYKAYRKAFMGTFDGQGHTISGLFINTEDTSYKGVKMNNSDSTYAALFGYVDKATVKNFTVNGFVSGCDVAGVIGILGESCNVDSVVSNVTVGGKTGENEEQSARGKVGGIVNMTKGDGSTIKNCTNNGSVTSTKKDGDNGIGDYAGGIIALIQHNNITIENCKNTGDISTYAYYVGGIVGAASDSAPGKAQFKVGIKKCENTGNITLIADEVNSKNDGVGAIIGACGANSAVTISDGCTNKGTISGKDTYDTDSLVGVCYPTSNGAVVTGVNKKNG